MSKAMTQLTLFPPPVGTPATIHGMTATVAPGIRDVRCPDGPGCFLPPPGTIVLLVDYPQGQRECQVPLDAGLLRKYSVVIEGFR